MSNPEDKSRDPLANFFGVPVGDEKITENVLVRVTTAETELDDDFNIARENLRQTAEISRQAIEEMARIAKQTEQPRSYDALSKMISAVVMANKAILEVHKHRQDVDEGPINPAATTHITNNTVFMTTADMQRRIEDARRELDREANPKDS